MQVLYKSTRGKGETVTASMAILKGLSEDGGLFVPTEIPKLDVPVEKLAQMTYQETAYEVMSRFLTDFTEEELKTFRLIDSRLQGHPNMNYVTGVDMSTGSLGQGFAVADGMALANKLAGNDHRIYCLIGDGETEEGEIWEAAMAAAHYKNDNLCAIIDVNGLQIDGKTSDVIGPEPLDQKFAAFGFHVICVDGHNMEELRAAFAEAKTVKGKPTAIIARTVKGKGVSFMENNAGWHGKAPNDEEYEIAMADLEKAGEALCQK